MLLAVRWAPSSLQYAGETCKDDREIILEAIEREVVFQGLRSMFVGARVADVCSGLRYAGEACKDDHEVVLKAVEKAPASLQYASMACKSNREIALKAVERDGCCLQYAGEALR